MFRSVEHHSKILETAALISVITADLDDSQALMVAYSQGNYFES